MGISAYISELLEENEYVIIPGFGAFISSYQPAKFEENKDILAPPSRLISFNPDLRIDDGVLLTYLVHRMKITTSQAHKFMEQYTDDIIYRLQSGEKVVIKQVGTMSKIGNTIQFEPENKGGYISEAFGLSPVEAKLPPKEQENKITREIVEPGTKNNRKKWFLRLFLFLGIGFVAVILILLLTKKESPSPEMKPDFQTENATLPGKAVTNTEVTVPGRQESGTTAEDIITKQLEEDLYYLIGGSFKSQINADEYLQKMVNKGLQPVSLGKAGNYYLVAVESYSTSGEAIKAANRMNNADPDAGIWIYHPQ